MLNVISLWPRIITYSLSTSHPRQRCILSFISLQLTYRLSTSHTRQRYMINIISLAKGHNLHPIHFQTLSALYARRYLTLAKDNHLQPIHVPSRQRCMLNVISLYPRSLTYYPRPIPVSAICSMSSHSG
jgi:hypothetical protein